MNTRPAAATHRPDPTWDPIWATVPAPWNTGHIRLDEQPFNEVFVRNTNYLRSVKDYDFRPTHPRMGQETSWWLWTIWREGTRKIDPAMLRWWKHAIDTLTTQRRARTIGDLNPALVVREALRQFEKRNGRIPSPGNQRNLESVAYSIHEHVTIRCSTQPWWTHDTWSLALDPRIPRREHEPAADRTINLAPITPTWLREGLRFWLSRALILDVYTWTSASTRIWYVATYFGRFATTHNITSPHVTSDPDQLRETFLTYLSWLKSPDATTTGQPLSNTSVAAAQSTLQRFYEFMHDHATDAAHATSDPRWRDLTANHTRLWAPDYRPKRRGNKRELTHIDTADVKKMLGYLDILSTPTDQTVTVCADPHPPITTRGLGDPQAARAWLIQALTGRRASEILMLDFNPLTTLPGLDQNPDNTAFIARLRYQQTKVDDIDPTILVERAVVNVITEQQTWVRDAFPDVPDPKHLFLNPRGNHKGLRPRSYRSYLDALKRFDHIVNLTDNDGRPLRFTQTHRLRHTRATELLNAGVPIHVVQRYLGHRSPEMTMRYAATLAATAEAEFLRYKKIGSDGRDLNLSPRDLLDLSQLDHRADRILPTGLCLLPPTQSCDKGNACLPCGSYATDASHLPEHLTQRDRTLALIDARQTQFTNRFGTPMPEDNIWLAGRHRELASLDAIITRLQDDTTNTETGTVSGPGTSARGAVPVHIVTDGAHAALLHNTTRNRLTP